MTQEFNPQFQKIGDILVHEGKISESQLNAALAEQKVRKEKLGIVLLDQGIINEDDLVKVYSCDFLYSLASYISSRPSGSVVFIDRIFKIVTMAPRINSKRIAIKIIQNKIFI